MQCPSRRIDCRCIPQRRLDLSQNARQSLRLLLQECTNVLVALALVAWLAGCHEIADAVGTELSSRVEMIEFERDLAGITVGASVIPLQEHIRSHLVACQCALLVLHAFDVWTL